MTPPLPDHKKDQGFHPEDPIVGGRQSTTTPPKERNSAQGRCSRSHRYKTEQGFRLNPNEQPYTPLETVARIDATMSSLDALCHRHGLHGPATSHIYFTW